MAKIVVKTPLVELDGDEMARVMWAMVKEKLILPFLDVKIDYYDLHLPHRDTTGDRVTVEAADAVATHGVGVKCATITPEPGRVKEYGLTRMWPNPNATIRARLDGTLFRCPILVGNIRPAVSGWKKPIVIARHAYGDVYQNAEIRAGGPGRAELLFTPEGGAPAERVLIQEFGGPGVVQGIHNTDDSIRGFARACCAYALERKIDLWFGTKDAVSRTYDGRFRAIFEEVFDQEYRQRFQAAGITYFYALIDDLVGRVMRSAGGMLWACKNYDGDILSDLLASVFGSLAMMTSVLVSPRGHYVYETAHGTVERHYRRHLMGEPTSSNSLALIFAWAGALAKRGELDGTPEVAAFARRLEQAAVTVIESGRVTADLVEMVEPRPSRHLSTEEFVDAVAAALPPPYSARAARGSTVTRVWPLSYLGPRYSARGPELSQGGV